MARVEARLVRIWECKSNSRLNIIEDVVVRLVPESADSAGKGDV